MEFDYYVELYWISARPYQQLRSELLAQLLLTRKRVVVITLGVAGSLLGG